MELRLEPADEYLHPLGPEPTFNESMYFNVYDPATDLGGFFRLGNRANEGRGEMTCCLYLPDRSAAFAFARPEVTTNDAFDAAGMRFEVVRPFEELTVRFAGEVLLLADPLVLADPREAYTTSPRADVTVELTYRGIAPPVGGEPTVPTERPGEEFARGHYEQLVGARGTITVGERRWQIDGWGLRDHSWGPRTWQAPWYYRWLVGCGGEDIGFMVSRIARRDSDGVRAGFVWDGSEVHGIGHCTVETRWADGHYQQTVEARLEGRERRWHLQGEVLSMVPLRNRRDGMVTRIAEGLTRWTLTPEDGEPRTAWGLSEYLDQIVEGLPVGLDE